MSRPTSGLGDRRDRWQARANCAGASDSGQFSESLAVQYRWALAFCGNCVVVDECRDHAHNNREKWGVWGGETEQQRRFRLNIRVRHVDDDDGDQAPCLPGMDCYNNEGDAA